MRLSNQLTSISSRFSSKGEYGKYISSKTKVVELLNKRGKDIRFFLYGSLTQLDYDQVHLNILNCFWRIKRLFVYTDFSMCRKSWWGGQSANQSRMHTSIAQYCFSLSSFQHSAPSRQLGWVESMSLLKHLLPPPLVIWSLILTNEFLQACFCMQVGESASMK